jgi:hypothetical protein
MPKPQAYAFPQRLYRFIRRRSQIVIGICATALILLGSTLYALPTGLSFQLFGAWLSFFAIVGLALNGLVRLALSIVGRKTRHLPYYRTVAVCISLLVASTCVPTTLGDVAAVVGRVLEDAFVVTPRTITALEKQATKTAAKELARQRSEASTTAYMFLMSGAVLIPNEGCYPPKAGKACDPQPISSTPGNGFWFLIVGVGSLLLARALAEARAAMSAKRRGEPFAIIPYPKWVAACVYAAILTPATYCAVGSLLFLSLDKHDTSLATVRQVLDREEASALALSPPVDINTTSLIAGYLPPKGDVGGKAKGKFDTAIGDARAALAGLDTWRAQYKESAINTATFSRSGVTVGEFEDYVSRLANRFSASIVQARSSTRACLQVLGDIGTLNTNAAATESAPDTAVLIDRASHLCQAALTKTGTMVLPGADASIASPRKAFYDRMYDWLSNAPSAAVRIVGLIGFGLFGSAISMMGRPDEVPYSYEDLAADEANVNKSREDVERQKPIAAQARAAARDEADHLRKVRDNIADLNRRIEARALEITTSKPDVDVAPLEKAQEADQKALAVAKETLVPQAEKAWIEKDAIATDAESKLGDAVKRLEAALTMLDAKRRALLDDRNSIVVGRTVTDPVTHERITEYTISGAPARVVVHGLGAAFTVFLVGESGVQLLTDGGQTSAVGLLLACFVGAVFAQDIWGAARETLKRRTPTYKDGAAPAK